MAKSPTTYILEGLFPTLSKYLSGGARQVTKQFTKQLVESSSPCRPLEVVAGQDDSKDEEDYPVEGIAEVVVGKDTPQEQLIAPCFISPHPSVTFAEVPTIYDVESRSVANSVSDPEQPFLLEEAIPSSPRSHVSITESASTKESSAVPREGIPMSQQSPKVQAESPAQSSRQASFESFDFESRKSLNRRSLPIFSLDHSRNVSSSSNETLVGSPTGSTSKSSPVPSPSDQTLRDEAEKVVRKNQAKKIRELMVDCEKLKAELAEEKGRADELESSLSVSERDRVRNFDSVLQIYARSGNLVLVERQNLLDEVYQLRCDVHLRESQIWERDQYIDALRSDLFRYANQEEWIRMQQCFYALQQQYGRMPHDLEVINQKYEDLEEEYIDVSHRFKQLEGNHTELKAQNDQVREERDHLEDSARQSKQSSDEVAARYQALEAHHNLMLGQKAESEKEARAKEQLLAGLATRMFERIISMAGTLDDMDVDMNDNEQEVLCQLACQHLGFDATELTYTFTRSRTDVNSQVKAEKNELDVPENHAGDNPSWISSFESNKHPPSFPLEGIIDSSVAAKAKGKNVSESPNTFDMRRRREVAAAEEAILGPLGLGFEDGSPTLKCKPTTAKKSKFMDLFPTSTDTPSRNGESSEASGDGDIEQVTPARTGGTSGISRDEWRTASNDLRGLTNVFRGPREQPIKLVSPGAGMIEPANCRRFNGKEPSQTLKEAALLPTKEEQDNQPSVPKPFDHPHFEPDFNPTTSEPKVPFTAAPMPQPSPSPSPSPTTATSSLPGPASINPTRNQIIQQSNDGPNRKQRRAAARERKIAAKKQEAQSKAEKARKEKKKAKTQPKQVK